jgi:hypothetical protein
VLVRRIVSAIALDDAGRVTVTYRQGRQRSANRAMPRIIGNAAPAALAALMPAPAENSGKAMRRQAPSASLFALTLGLAKPPREFGIAAYSTQLLPPWMKRLADYAQGAALMAESPAT